MITLNELVAKCDTLDSQQKFRCRDLVAAVDWNREKRGKRIKIGSNFFDLVEAGEIEGVKALEKDSQNAQVYIKE
ncbi:DUF1413 domain-containing protein [Listeria booriae]|uniref:DUF1413 domain-containing protein n=1 Tax=Listeria booriae TaxID=1552123 RepID=A0A7X1DSP0_9LIST|nr:DUF1413 domain-containing protein [Listeria booriae]MBC1618025.1 DUF1413 domain-containing protein [Listeria booriae]MBC2373765.1 DUF1413 domain-containing protein [Listeria booriae]MDT0112151.1 DUF1413 domain-containing protein [Listeria booriae]